MKWGRLRAVRWAGASIVFQGAMHSLNAVHRIGDQIAEPILLHEEGDPGRGRQAGRRAAGAGRPARRPGRRLPARAVRRAAPARHDRHGAGLRPAADHRRRADDRAGRDDPGADPRLIEQLVAEQDISLIMISHDLAVLADTCDRLAVMYAGRVVEEGPARQVYEDARHPYSRALSAAFPRIGDPASRLRPAAWPATRPTRRRCRRLHLPSALPGRRWTPAPTWTRCCGRPGRTRGPPASWSAALARPGRLSPGGRRPAPMTTASGTLLSAQGLHVTFPARGAARPARAVDGVDLDCGPGEIVALVGESGCGKTTLARTLLGLVRPTAGTVPYGGRPLDYSAPGAEGLPQARPAGAAGPERLAQPPAHGLRGGRRGPAHPRHAGDERTAVAEALSRAGLRPPERFFLRYPHELSGGQRQRVVIAGALVLDPELLVADEPVASLDASVRGEILALLLRLRDELGLSALVVTHDLGLAWNIADRVAVMYLGRIVETGPVEQVLTAPSIPTRRRCCRCCPSPGARRRGADRRAAGPVPDPGRLPLPRPLPGPRLGRGGAAGVADRCRTDDLPVLGVGDESQVACHYARSGSRPSLDRGEPARRRHRGVPRAGPGLQTRIRTHATYSEAPDDIDGNRPGACRPRHWRRRSRHRLRHGRAPAHGSQHATPGRIVGCDLSPEAVRGAADDRGSRGPAGPMRSHFPFRDAQFDLVMARHMLYHVSDVGSAIREARRVLSPEGSFVVTVNRRRVTPRTVALVRTSIANEGLQPRPGRPERPGACRQRHSTCSSGRSARSTYTGTTTRWCSRSPSR